MIEAKEVYYYKKKHYLYVIFCSKHYIKLIDPQEIKFKKADKWLNDNHWPLIVDSFFSPNKLLNEVIIN